MWQPPPVQYWWHTPSMTSLHSVGITTSDDVVVGFFPILICIFLIRNASVDVRKMEVKTSSIEYKQLGQFMFQRGSLKQEMLRYWTAWNNRQPEPLGSRHIFTYDWTLRKTLNAWVCMAKSIVNNRSRYLVGYTGNQNVTPAGIFAWFLAT